MLKKIKFRINERYFREYDSYHDNSGKLVRPEPELAETNGIARMVYSLDKSVFKNFIKGSLKDIKTFPVLSLSESYPVYFDLSSNFLNTYHGVPVNRVMFANCDKYHRCPNCCLHSLSYQGMNGLQFHKECGTLVLPFNARWLNPEWVSHYFSFVVPLMISQKVESPYYGTWHDDLRNKISRKI